MAGRSNPNGPPQIAGLTYVRDLNPGGFGDVYLYRQDRPARNVAVKVLRGASGDSALVDEVTAEANAMAALAHPFIADVYQADVTADGRAYLTMAYYPRPDFAARAAIGPMRVAEVLRTGIQIASAVEYAHRARFLHRDIKPANILTSEFDQPKLTDFGIATQIAAQTEDEDTPLSVNWAAPEVIAGSQRPSVQSDVYSLAATLWHLLVGRSPFEVPGGNNEAHAIAVRARTTVAPATGRGDVPQALERLLGHALAHNPSARPRSALDLARSLQDIEQALQLPRTDITLGGTEQEARDPEARGGTAKRTVAAQRVVGAQSVDGQSSRRTVNRTRDDEMPARPSEPGTDSPQRTIRRGDAGGLATAPDPASLPARASLAPRAPTAESTVRRQRVEPDAVNEPPVRGGSGRTIVLVIAALAVVAAVIIALVLGSGTGRSRDAKASGSLSQSDVQSQDAGDPAGALPPGQPDVSARRLNAGTVRFSWTYSAQLSDDTFLWRTTTSAGTHVTDHPSVDVSTRAGARVCVEVRVVRADGSFADSQFSAPGCST